MKVKTEHLIKKTNAEGCEPEMDNTQYRKHILYSQFNKELIWFQDLTLSPKKRKQFDSF